MRWHDYRDNLLVLAAALQATGHFPDPESVLRFFREPQRYELHWLRLERGLPLEVAEGLG